MLGRFYGSTHSGSAPRPPPPLLLPFFCLVSGSAPLPATCPHMLGAGENRKGSWLGQGHAVLSGMTWLWPNLSHPLPQHRVTFLAQNLPL